MSTRGWENATPMDTRHRRQATTMVQKPRSKYGAVKTTVDGIAFDSGKEARRYQELKLMQQSGQIRLLRWQRRYMLCALVIDGADIRDVNAGAIVNRRHPVCEYVGDFEYEEPNPSVPLHWRVVVEDVKSPPTRRKEVYRLKRKLFEAQYGIQIREV